MKKIRKKSHAMKQIETKLGGDIEEVLRALYVDKNMPVHQLCKTLGISYVTALKWLRLSGVRSRRLKVDN
jgi:transposase-like protein